MNESQDKRRSRVKAKQAKYYKKEKEVMARKALYKPEVWFVPEQEAVYREDLERTK